MKASAGKIKQVRTSLGLSVTDCARQVRIADRSWQRYESGDREPPEGLLELFCMKNGLNFEDTFRGARDSAKEGQL
jgi:transcriptional regulator with XRE-family HTH domain